MEQKRSYKIFTNLESDGYVQAILANAIQERDELISKSPALRKIQEKIDTSMENINKFEDRLFILAAATRVMTNKQ